MWLRCQRRPYCKEDGELRSRPPHHHTHLKFVHISGFFGHKDQVELALQILRSSIMLEKLEINPRVEIADCDESENNFMRENSTWMVIESPLNLFARQTTAML